MEETQTEAQSLILSVEEIKQALQEPKIQKNLIANANLLLERVSKNWFNLDRVIRKTHFKQPNAAKEVLDLLVLAGFAHVKEEDLVLKWKITLSKESKLDALKDDVEAISAQIMLLEDKKKAIISRITFDDPTYQPGNPDANHSMFSISSGPSAL